MTDADDTYRGWRRPGPRVPGGIDVEDGETLDWLCGHFRIFQYRDGHRFSVDDVLCAHYASSWAPRVERACDLGSGIGSVAQCVAWRLPGCSLVTVEAQQISLRLAEKTARYNGTASRVTMLLGDLRDDAVRAELRARGPFDLVTGTPPYWPVGTALPAQHPQAVPARLEVRGDVRDYAATASAILAPGGMFCCVHQAVHAPRVEQALVDAGLTLIRKRDVAFKEGAPPVESGITLFAAMRSVDLPRSFAAGTPGKPVVEPPLVLRRKDGSVHPEYATLRLSYGFPPGDMAAEQLL